MNQLFIASHGRVNVPGSGTLHDTLPGGRYSVEFTMEGPRITFVAENPANAERLEYLPGSPAATVVDDIRQFIGAKSKFANLGLGYKRGYLMYGPPGTGKSATLQMILDEVIREHQAVVINGNECSMSQIQVLRQLAGPDRLIVGLIEEVDEFVRNQGSRALSMLDGTQCTNVVFLATTNYLEDLAPRIRKRPGRFDRVVDVSEYPDESRAAYFKSRVKPAELPVYVKAAKGLPIAAWREVLLRVTLGGVTPAAAGKELRAWLKECADDDSEDE
jgi:SpoVK/Ycf46/Vps4 family AAA+-type ATPase